MKRTAALLALLFLGKLAFATTWAPAEMTDPLTGEKVPSKTIMSYGGYIYGWPSKYDLVFWPATDANWICVNPKNGYGAFNPDFETLPDEEKKALTEWLKDNYDSANPPTTYAEKLAWMEKLYSQRKVDDGFWCRFYRLMAYVHREDEKTSMAYVKKALPLLEKELASNPEGEDRLEVVYLLGEYHRRLGDNKKAVEFFSKVKDVKFKDEDGNEQTGHPYFMELVIDRKKLITEDASTKPDSDEEN